MQTDFEMKHADDSFNEKELSAMHETELFRLKYLVIDKVVIQFHHLAGPVKKVMEQYDLPGEIAKARVRIFRGDNYKLLPYAVMDYPALYGKENSFAYRTMFWWGNFFSFTLFLHGAYLDRYRENLSGGISKLKGRGFYFCVNQTPWQYYYERDNYIPVDELLKQGNKSIGKSVAQRDFIKLSRYIKIAEWEKLNRACTESLELVLKAAGA